MPSQQAREADQGAHPCFALVSQANAALARAVELSFAETGIQRVLAGLGLWLVCLWLFWGFFP